MRRSILISILMAALVGCGDNASPPPSIMAIAAGSFHTMALKYDGAVWTWGWNLSGRLGDGTTTDRSIPVQVVDPGGPGNLGDVVAIAGGGSHTIALKGNGTVWTWGDNMYGQLGVGVIGGFSTTPVHVVSAGGFGYLTGIVAIADGGSHTIALKDDGTVWTWGYNGTGQLGDGTTTDSGMPVQVLAPGGSGYLTDITAIAGGGLHSIALKDDGTVWSWGYNAYGQLGNGTTTDSSRPVQVKGPGGSGYLTGIVAVAGGYEHGIALKDDGTVWAWGYNFNGQLGDGTIIDSSTPVQVRGSGGSGFLTGIVAIESGDWHGMGLKDDGTVWTWGANWAGQLGDGTTAIRTTPVQVKGPGGSGYLAGIAAITGGYWHSAALRSDGSVWAWGANSIGQLGDGTTVDSSTPVQVVWP